MKRIKPYSTYAWTSEIYILNLVLSYFSLVKIVITFYREQKNNYASQIEIKEYTFPEFLRENILPLSKYRHSEYTLAYFSSYINSKIYQQLVVDPKSFHLKYFCRTYKLSASNPCFFEYDSFIPIDNELFHRSNVRPNFNCCLP